MRRWIDRRWCTPSERILNPISDCHVDVQVGRSLHHNRQIEFGEPPAIAGVRRQTSLRFRQSLGGELLLTDPGDLKSLGELKLVEQIGCPKVKLAVLLPEQRAERAVQFLEEGNIVIQAVSDELECAHIGGRFLDRIARYQEDGLVQDMSHAQLVEDIGVSATTIGDNDVGFLNLLPDLVQQRDGENPSVAATQETPKVVSMCRFM
jgi:hypothetical protein